eukprot:19986-Heterococcus_DN1.PRE.3
MSSLKHTVATAAAVDVVFEFRDALQGYEWHQSKHRINIRAMFISCIAAASVQQLCSNKLCCIHLYLQSLLCSKAAAFSSDMNADAGCVLVDRFLQQLELAFDAQRSVNYVKRAVLQLAAPPYRQRKEAAKKAQRRYFKAKVTAAKAYDAELVAIEQTHAMGRTEPSRKCSR